VELGIFSDQGELDELSENMATRFHTNGLTLFTDPTGTVPTPTPPPAQNGYVGFASTIQVNPAVLADPSQVRDGDVPPVPTQAGYTAIINAVLNNTLGGNPPLAANVTGLGASGTLSAPFNSPPTLVGFASSMLAAQAEGRRAAVVVTGRGVQGDGVLRRRAPEWLAEPHLRDVVAGVAEAHRRHGGDGAVYVALKRRKPA